MASKSNRRDKKRRQRLASHSQVSANARVAIAKPLDHFFRVFGEDSSAILELATSGASPQEISERLDVPLVDVERFIESFSSLPSGLDSLLMRKPGLLSKGKAIKSELRSALRAARASRGGRYG